jgi:hypothetical protein
MEADSEYAGYSNNAATIDAHPKSFANTFIRSSVLRYVPSILCDFSPVSTVFPGSLKSSSFFFFTDKNPDLFDGFQEPGMR